MSSNSSLTDSDEEEKKEIPAKKAKIAKENPSSSKKAGKKLASDPDNSDDEGSDSNQPVGKGVKREKDQSGVDLYPIGNKRFVSLSRFKGRLLINIREYYQKDNQGPWLPGKKGISLSQDQLQSFEKLLPEIKKKMSSV